MVSKIWYRVTLKMKKNVKGAGPYKGQFWKAGKIYTLRRKMLPKIAKEQKTTKEYILLKMERY